MKIAELKKNEKKVVELVGLLIKEMVKKSKNTKELKVLLLELIETTKNHEKNQT